MSKKLKKEVVTIKCPECNKKQDFDIKNLENLKNYEPLNVFCDRCKKVFWVSKLSDKGTRLIEEAKQFMTLPDVFLTVCGENCVLIITPAAPVHGPQEDSSEGK